MKAMVLKKISCLDTNPNPLQWTDFPNPIPKEKEILVKISACGVCHTELDEIEGRASPSHFPIILGHQVVGTVEERGPGTNRFQTNDRVGIGWIHSACRKCKFCLNGKENLCNKFMATGRDANGGYAEYMTIQEDFASPIPSPFSDSEAAPLLCAGAIGYRSLKLTGIKNGQKLGLTGFGASAHLVAKMVKHSHPGCSLFVFARNKNERLFAKELGADWTGDTGDLSPEKLDAIIDTTPAWMPVIDALKNLESGGRLIINAIRKEPLDKQELLRLEYPVHLWLEKEIKSVANVTRNDIEEFLKLAAEIGIRPEIQEYPLKEANSALTELKNQKIRGAKVLKIS